MDFLTDTFTGAGLPHLSAHSPDVGGAWTQDAGSSTDMGLTSTFAGECTMTGGGDVGYTNSAAPPGPDYSASITMRGDPGVSNEQALCIRKNTAAGNRYEARFVPPNILRLNKVVGGSITTLASTTISLPDSASPPTVILIQATGTALSVTVDGSPALSATDGSISAAGLVGFNGSRSPGQPLFLDNLHAFAPPPTLVRRTEYERAGTRGSCG